MALDLRWNRRVLVRRDRVHHGGNTVSAPHELYSDTYYAVVQLEPGRYAGEVRAVHGGQIDMCSHSHKRRSLAADCARRLLKKRTA